MSKASLLLIIPLILAILGGFEQDIYLFVSSILSLLIIVVINIREEK